MGSKEESVSKRETFIVLVTSSVLDRLGLKVLLGAQVQIAKRRLGLPELLLQVPLSDFF